MLEVWGLNGLYSLRGPNFAKEFPARSLNWRVIGEVSPPSQDGTESFIYMAALVYFTYMDIGKGVSNVSIYRESLRKTQNLRVSWEWRHWSPHLWIQFQVSVMSEGMRKRMCWGPSVFLQGHNTFLQKYTLEFSAFMLKAVNIPLSPLTSLGSTVAPPSSLPWISSSPSGSKVASPDRVDSKWWMQNLGLGSSHTLFIARFLYYKQPSL